MYVHLAGLPAQRGEGLCSPEKATTPCVLERLCEQHDGLVMEAKSIKQHYFRPYMHRLFSRQVPTKPPQSSLHTSLLQTLYAPALQQTGPHKTPTVLATHLTTSDPTCTGSSADRSPQNTHACTHTRTLHNMPFINNLAPHSNSSVAILSPMIWCYDWPSLNLRSSSVTDSERK